MITPRSLLVTLLASVLCVAGLIGAPAGAGTSPLRTDAIYQSRGQTRLTFVPLVTRGNGSGLVRLHAELRCEDQDVIGDVLVTVDAKGKFELETDGFFSTKDIGSDTEVTVSGQFSRTTADGTVDVHARAYDEEGT